MSEQAQKQQVSTVSERKILVFESSDVLRRQLVELIRKQPDLGICLEAASSAEALEAVEKQQVSLSVVDIAAQDADSLELAQQIRMRCPAMPVLLLSMADYIQSEDETVDVRASEQITAALNYIHSLLESRVYGFTVCLKVERKLSE